METFIKAKPFVKNPDYKERREDALNKIDFHDIDAPIVDIIKGFATLPYCFSLQCCYGHFVHESQEDPNNVEPLSNYDEGGLIKYRIAYVAFCIQNNDSGRNLYDDLEAIAETNPGYIQFGSADWFWRKNVNSYALQVEPDVNKTKDSVVVNVDKALHLQEARNQMFEALRRILRKNQQLTNIK